MPVLKAVLTKDFSVNVQERLKIRTFNSFFAIHKERPLLELKYLIKGWDMNVFLSSGGSFGHL